MSYSKHGSAGRGVLLIFISTFSHGFVDVATHAILNVHPHIVTQCIKSFKNCLQTEFEMIQGFIIIILLKRNVQLPLEKLERSFSIIKGSQPVRAPGCPIGKTALCEASLFKTSHVKLRAQLKLGDDSSQVEVLEQLESKSNSS